MNIRSSTPELRRLVLIAVIASILGGLHFVDHVVRGNLVIAHGLDPRWNHSGWPFLATVTPFTFSLFGVVALLGYGLVSAARGIVRPRYWLIVSLLLLGLVGFVHFLAPQPELPRVIYSTYADVHEPVMGIFALIDFFSLLLAIVVLAWNAAASLRKPDVAG